MSTYRENHPKRRTAYRREEDRLLRKQIDTYIKLFNIGQVITSEMNFDALFDVIADQTNKILGSQRCSVFLIDEKGSYLTTFVSTDIKRDEIRIPCSQGVAGWVFSNQLPLIVEDAYSDNRFYPGIDGITGFKTNNILCVPLINRKNECIGTLQALNKKSGDFTDDDREIITYLSNYVTVAIENAKLYEELIAGGMGLDLMRNKIFARMYGFSLTFESKRCQYIPQDTDQCRGRISECPHIKDLSGCLVSGGSKFTIIFPKSN